MKMVIQRVNNSYVKVDDQIIGKIGKGLNILLGIHQDDQIQDVDFMVNKAKNLRIFQDEQGKMNLSAEDVGGDILVISQFTLYGDCQKGNRPSFSQSGNGEFAKKLYLSFVKKLNECFSGDVQTGQFGEKMDVFIENDGPVTLIVESKS